MNSSKNRRQTRLFQKFSRLRVNLKCTILSYWHWYKETIFTVKKNKYTILLILCSSVNYFINFLFKRKFPHFDIGYFQLLSFKVSKYLSFLFTIRFRWSHLRLHVFKSSKFLFWILTMVANGYNIKTVIFFLPNNCW